MTRRIVGIAAVILLAGVAAAFATSPAGDAPSPEPRADSDKSWITKSNGYADLLIEIEKKHSPESASSDGLKQYDELISIATHEDDVAENNERKAALEKLKAALAKEQDKYVKQDLEIMIHNTELGLRRHDFSEDHEVNFQNASAGVFLGSAPCSMTKSRQIVAPQPSSAFASTPASSPASRRSPNRSRSSPNSRSRNPT